MLEFLNKKFFNKEPDTEEVTEVKEHSEQAVVAPDIYLTGTLLADTQVSNRDKIPATLGYEVYRQMSDDDQVKPALMLKKLAMLAGGWEVVPHSDDSTDVEMAEFIKFNFEQMDGSIEKSLLEILEALDFGYSLGEILFKVNDSSSFSGKVILKAIKSKDPSDFEFVIDRFGNILPSGLIQVSTSKPLPMKKFLYFAYNSRFGNVYGRSDLKAAYKAWFSKGIVLKGWNMYIERFGMPIPVGLYNQRMTPENQSILQQIFDRIQFKTSMVLPKHLIDELKLMEVSGTGSDIFERCIAYYDRAIARSILVPDQMGLGGRESGSLAKAVEQFNVFMLSIKQLQKEIGEHVIKEQLIKPLIDLNFGVQEAYPTFSFIPEKDEARQKLASIWIDAAKNGIVSPDLIDENKLRDLLGFPERSAEDKEDDTEEPEFLPDGEDPDTEKDPEDSPPEEEEDEDEELLKANCCILKNHVSRDRELSSFEKKVNFQEIENNILEAEKEMFTSTQAVIVKQKNALIKSVTRMLRSNTMTPAVVRELSLPFQSELTRTIKKGLLGSYTSFKADGRKEIAVLKKMTVTGESILPQQAINFFTNKSFMVSGSINDQLTNKIKQQIMSGLKEGLDTQSIIKNIEEAFLPFTGDPLTDPELNIPHRLETIVRTNLNEAYNQGRKDAFAESVADGFVIGYFYSAIIDGRQTEICNFLDGLILPVNDSRTDRLIPPNHFNERSVIVPVTRDEAPVTFATNAQLNRGLTLRAETGF